MTAVLTALLVGLVAATALSLVWVRNLFASLVLLSGLSGFVVALLALLGAVDVAFMEAVVGVAVSAMFFMALVRKVDPGDLPRTEARHPLVGVVASLAFGCAVLVGVSALPAFGDPQAPAAVHVSPAYVERSVDDMETPNVVTAVLADYRGFDTLIETAVVMTAAMACVLLLGRRP